jgi:hypothetical protein
MTLEYEMFQISHGMLCKDRLRKKHHDESCRTILSLIENLPGDKVECYCSTLDNEYRGDTYFDVLLLVKTCEEEGGFMPIVIKNTMLCAVGRCIEYTDYNEGGVEYCVVDYENWNVDTLMKHVQEKYRDGLLDFLVKKYNLVRDEVILF